MPAPFSKIGEVIRRLAPRLGLEVRLLELLVRQRWEGIVGEQVARQTQPGAIRFKKLTVHARSSIWVQQLTFLKPALLQKINEAAGAPVITDLLLRVGELDERPPERREEAAEREASRAAVPPTDAELEDAARHVPALRDPALRDQLLRLIAAAPPSAEEGPSPARSLPTGPLKSRRE